MRILVDSCSYNCQNVGDLAMLTVAVSRLRELWPAASIDVITNAPALVVRHCGSVGTVPVRGRRLLLAEHLLGPARRWLPGTVRRRWDDAEARLRVSRPRLFRLSLGVKEGLRGRHSSDAAAFLDALDRADLVVVNGAGILTDAFKESALGILATLDLAVRRDVPTALFGQGLGPIEDRELWHRAAEVLPHVRLIAVREAKSSLPLLTALGVDRASVVVTGDDAVELAFASTIPTNGSSDRGTPKIGINVRVAPYADVGQGMLSALRQAFRTAARRHHADLLPIPIAHHGGGMDIDTLRTLLCGDGGAALDTPQRVIERIAECRVMVTGSYHGAVFALSQGIPVVALAKSQYYVNKMAGVADQFGVGCEIVRLDCDPEDLTARLEAAIDRAWTDADRVRAPLLGAAADQIQRARGAYGRLREFIALPPSRHPQPAGGR
jgi:polysaccharide pyruvyl transferase WcaK-like protein